MTAWALAVDRLKAAAKVLIRDPEKLSATASFPSVTSANATAAKGPLTPPPRGG